MANLRADARTAGVPIFLYGPLGLEDRLPLSQKGFPRVTFVVTPTEALSFKPVFSREMARMGTRPLSSAERNSYALHATELLALAASRPGGPFAAAVVACEPELTAALSQPLSAAPASVALSDVPSPNAQRSLADVVIDAARPFEQRARAGADLARSLQRFGPLVSAEQESKLAEEYDGVSEPAIKAILGQVIGALRPKSAVVGPRLRNIHPNSALSSGSEPPPAPEPAAESGPAPAPAPAPAPEPGPEPAAP